MVLFDGYGPRIVALGINLSIQVVSILFMPYFRFRSVRPKLQASSGRIGEAVRATQRQQYWRYIAENANIIGAAWLTALIGEAGKRSPHLQANSQRQYEVFADFFMFAALRLLAEYESQHQQYWHSIRKMKEQAKRGKLFAALRLLLQKSPNNFAVLTGNGNTFDTRRRQIKNSKQCPAPQSQANTQRLALFQTHLSFRWTLPLTSTDKCNLSPVSCKTGHCKYEIKLSPKRFFFVLRDDHKYILFEAD